MRVTKYLVVNGRGDMKIRATEPRLKAVQYDEIVFPITVNIPNTWRKVYPEVTVDIPEPTQATLDIAEAQPVLDALAGA